MREKINDFEKKYYVNPRMKKLFYQASNKL